MQWKGRRRSGNVEDNRGETHRGASGGGGGLGLLMMIGRRFGLKGILAAVALVLVLWKLGFVDPSMLLGGGATVSRQKVEISPVEQERFEFVKVVLAGTEDIFSAEFARLGKRYELPKLIVYRGKVLTACGTGDAAMGPFYCPGDRKIYIDLGFYDELDKTFEAPGDFAQAYVVAHEVGHHIQKLLGASDKVNAKRGQPDFNEYSVRLELQADFYAGVWAHHTRDCLDRGKIEEATLSRCPTAACEFRGFITDCLTGRAVSRRYHAPLMKLILTLLAATCAALSAAPDGKQLFTNNCSACHMLDQMVVGPSLAEIRGLYNGKPDEFVKWNIAPRKKRPNAIEMPSMVHVGDEGLRAIYEYIMQFSEGAVEKKAAEGDPYATSSTQAARPQVMRIFMPDASPASIAVALDDINSICWDAGSSRLRYAWTGGFIDGFPYWRGNGNGLARILGVVRYTEAASPFGKDASMKFLGYKLKDGLPVFRYKAGDMAVTESYSPADAGFGFVRAFTVSTPAPLTLDFPEQTGVTVSTDKGKLEGGKLTLTPAEAAAFTLTYSLK